MVAVVVSVVSLVVSLVALGHSGRSAAAAEDNADVNRIRNSREEHGVSLANEVEKLATLQVEMPDRQTVVVQNGGPAAATLLSCSTVGGVLGGWRAEGMALEVGQRLYFGYHGAGDGDLVRIALSWSTPGGQFEKEFVAQRP